MYIFDETYTNEFLHPSFWHLIPVFIIKQVISLKLIKLMTHSEAHHHHTNYSWLSKVVVT